MEIKIRSVTEDRYSWNLRPLSDIYGQKILKAFKNSDLDAIQIDLPTGSYLLKDEGQSCCEHRYLVVEPGELDDLVGKDLEKIEVKLHDSLQSPDGYGYDEIAFIEIRASGLVVSLAAHNEHSGYYGGFDLVLVQQPIEVSLDVKTEA